MHAQGIELGNYPPPKKKKQNKTKQNPVGGQKND